MSLPSPSEGSHAARADGLSYSTPLLVVSALIVVGSQSNHRLRPLDGAVRCPGPSVCRSAIRPRHAGRNAYRRHRTSIGPSLITASNRSEHVSYEVETGFISARYGLLYLENEFACLLESLTHLCAINSATTHSLDLDSLPVQAVTSDLSTVLPFDEIDAYFNGRVERSEMRISQLADVARLCRSDLNLLTLNCASRTKQLFRKDLDLSALAPELGRGDPDSVNTLSRLLGESVIKDIYVCRCTVEDELVAAVLIAHVFPKELYVGKVTFVDPNQPIADHERRSALQTNKGLRLLPTFLDRVEQCARARGCDYITLVANETSLQNLFQKHGFVVDVYSSAKNAEATGRTIPMHKTVS